MPSLLGFLVDGMFLAETAVLAHFKSVRVILLVFHCVVVALFALAARQCDSDSHIIPPDIIDAARRPSQAGQTADVRLTKLSPSSAGGTTKKPLRRGNTIISCFFPVVNGKERFFPQNPVVLQ